jgi:hypothetical protein
MSDTYADYGFDPNAGGIDDLTDAYFAMMSDAADADGDFDGNTGPYDGDPTPASPSPWEGDYPIPPERWGQMQRSAQEDAIRAMANAARNGRR